MQGPDGLFYYPLTGRPWAADVSVDQGFGSMAADGQYAEPWAKGRVLNAIALYYELTGDQRWKELGEGIVDGLIEHAVEREDYAYFPKGICGVNEFPDGNEPPPEKWTGGASAWICMGLSVFFRSTEYGPAMVLAGKLARFVRYHGHLLDSEGQFIGENAWGGPPHFHMHTGQLLGLLQYAMIAGDWELIQFVRKGFEFAKTKMDSTLLGYTPEYIDNPKETDFSPELAEYLGGPQTSEPCGEADMVALAIKLTGPVPGTTGTMSTGGLAITLPRAS